MKTSFQLQTPLDAILFDCDGTLSSIEGVDELAMSAGPEVAETVQALTAEAMGKSGINPDIYEQRLALIGPGKLAIDALAEKYFAHCTPDVIAVIALLQRLGKSIYILSAGLLPAVLAFARRLHVPEQHVFAVHVQFDAAGHYRDFDHASPLIYNDGKRQIVQQLQKQHRQMLYVGDGLNDIAVRDLVSRFIGYGGSYYRANIAEQCDYYIKEKTLLPLLPLALTLDEVNQLTQDEMEMYKRGVGMLC